MELESLRNAMESLIPFNYWLGVKITAIEAGFVRMEIPFRNELVGDPLRPALHGGIISALADAAGGAAVWSATEYAKMRVSTIDLRLDFLRPGKLEPLVAEARVVRMGNRVGVTDMKLFNAAAPDIAIATGKGVYNVTVAKDR